MTDVFDEIRDDLAAFADDDEQVVVERDGQCLLVRGGRDIAFVLERDENGGLFVTLDNRRMRYRDFLANELGQLNVLAERIIAKRSAVPAFVDSDAVLEAPAKEREAGSALSLLARECSHPGTFVSRVTFITADAGQGKTALLRQFQHEQAERFLRGEGRFVFWHVDLQGRQLLRLHEALMGDLSDLRVAGLWMPAVIRLLRHGVLVLAIDGFDELAAEQGTGDALGALALLVQSMGDTGTIVAASRRTFFDTDDYLRRARLVVRPAAGNTQFDQISLRDWGPEDARSYLAKASEDDRRLEAPAAVYDDILSELGGDTEHPMLTRPFLLTYLARALLRFDIEPKTFIRGMDADDPFRGVGALIEAFVDREVREKWKQKDTGEPYLTREQHLRFLADVAEEMLRLERTTLDVEMIETIAAMLFEEWRIEPFRRQQALEMVRMHVLLTRPDDGDERIRSFDHEEFLAWFTAYAIKDRLERLKAEGSSVAHELLSATQISDATARYVCALIERTPARVAEIVSAMETLVDREWRPTYLQMNIGTLIPSLLDGMRLLEPIATPQGLVFSSVVFEGTELSDVTVEGGTFLNASFADTRWRRVQFVGCRMGEPTLSRTALYEDVEFRDCVLDGLHVIDEDGEEHREYSPLRIRQFLRSLGINVLMTDEQPDPVSREPLVEGDTRRLVKRVLNLFRRTTIASERVIALRFSRDAGRIVDEVLPLMVRHGIVEERTWRGSGKVRAWGPQMSVEEIEKADGATSGELRAFWEDVDARDAKAAGRNSK